MLRGGLGGAARVPGGETGGPLALTASTDQSSAWMNVPGHVLFEQRARDRCQP